MSIQKIITIGALSTILFFPTAISAADTQETQTCGIVCRIQRAFNQLGGRNQENPGFGNKKGPSGASGAQGRLNPENRLSQAITDGKLTQVQADEITSRLSAIKTKQQELRDLEKSLADWMKTNNLPASLIGRPPQGGQNQQGTGNNTESTGETESTE